MNPTTPTPVPCAALHLSTQASPAQPVIAADSALQSDALLRGKKSVAIEHNGLVYRLQATRLGKLILTK